MTKVAKSKTSHEKPNKPPKKNVFKPDIRFANAIVGAIAFLQKAGIQATPKIIKKCITIRSKKGFAKSLTHLPLYLIRGLELGILKKWHGSYKLGEFKIKKKSPKKRSVEKNGKKVEVIKEATRSDMRGVGHSGKSSVCAF